MLAGGIPDDTGEAMRYLLALTGEDVDPAVVRAFVEEGPRMLRFLEQNSHVRYEAMLHYADYYQELPGARPGGRSIDPLPWHARHLGEDFLAMQPSHVQTTVMGLMGYTNIEGAVLLSKAPGWLARGGQTRAGIPGRYRLAFAIEALAASHHGKCADGAAAPLAARSRCAGPAVDAGTRLDPRG